MTRRGTLSPAWRDALDRFEESNGAADGASQRARITRIRRLAEEIGGDPWDVTPNDVAEWLSKLGASDEATRKYRHAARSFYRWAVSVSAMDANPVTSPARSSYECDSKWGDALAQFLKAQRAKGMAEETAQLRAAHVRRFARESNLDPWSVIHADYAIWIAGLGVADATRAKVRDSLRAFYRWAHGRGRIDEDPTAEPSRRATTPPVSTQWDDALRPWRSWLRGAGHPEPTVRLRLIQLRRFARDHESLDPWAVSLDDLIDWMAGQRWASETRRAYRSALRSFYAWAYETGRMDENPSSRLPAVRMSKPQPRPAKEDDYERAVRMAEPSDRLAIQLAAELGMRCAEVRRATAET